MLPDVRLEVAGLLYGGWKSISISRSIEQISGSFDLTVSDRWPGQASGRPILTGDSCRLLVDGEVLITGYVDDMSISHDGSKHEVSVSGRDKTGDLVDCSAIKGSGQWANRKLEQIAADLCAPFGIQVHTAVDTGKAFSNFALQEGESVFEALERMAKIRAVLLTADGAGALVITRPGNDRVDTDLVLGQNILEASGSSSQRERYSQYILKGQSAGGDSWNGAQAAQAKSTAGDPAVTRYRPLVVVSDSQGDGLSLKDRALWEATFRAARATDVAITAQGWKHRGGIWAPNAIVHVKDEFLGLDDDLLIKSVNLVLNESGTRAMLGLTRPDAFKLQPLKEPAAKRSGGSGSSSGSFFTLPKGGSA